MIGKITVYILFCVVCLVIDLCVLMNAFHERSFFFNKKNVIKSRDRNNKNGMGLCSAG